MALTSTQIADVRRYCGWPILASPADDPAIIEGTGQTLSALLASLDAVQEGILTTKHLTSLATLEDAVPAAGANLDTSAASVWTRNPNEVVDRTRLFNQCRRDLCGFLGVPPGPSLEDAGAGMSSAPLRF